MNTPKLPPLPPQRRKVFRTAIGPVEVQAYSEEDMQAYAIAAIEVQGVPDCKVVDIGFRWDADRQ